MSAHRVWQKAFLKSLANCGIVRQACAEARVDRKTVYNLRHADPAFAKEWVDALDSAADELESEVRRRAFAGSDLLLIFLMKALRPEKFREKVYVSTSQLDELIERELQRARGEEQAESGMPVVM